MPRERRWVVSGEEVKARDRVAAEIERDRIDELFIKAGHRPENRNCDHKQWRSVRKDGRYCSCGTCMFDPGD